jgi:hypothetical protein
MKSSSFVNTTTPALRARSKISGSSASLKVAGTKVVGNGVSNCTTYDPAPVIINVGGGEDFQCVASSGTVNCIVMGACIAP